MTFFERSACVAACLLIGACGGKVAGPGTGTGTGTGDGTAGASGTFGDGMGMGSVDPGQSTPGSNPGTGMVTPGNASCQMLCDRISQAGCAIDDCFNHCNLSIVENSPCLPLYEAALQCFAQAPIQCDPNGNGVDFLGCDTQREVVAQCISKTGPTTPPPPPNPTKPIPAQCLGAAPLPPDGMVCSGGSSGGGTGSTGGGGPLTCQSECDDAKGNVWSSYCVGSNCSCMYNGKTYCSCVSASPCSSCCPGI